MVGGAERSVQLLAEGLQNYGHEVVVVSTSSIPGIQISTVNSVKVYYVGLKNLYWPFDTDQNNLLLKVGWHIINSYNSLMAAEFRKILRSEQPDLVHTNNLVGFSTAIWPIVKSFGLPLIHTTRDFSLLCPRQMFRKGSNCASQCGLCKPFSLFAREHSRHVDAVVGISNYILEEHLRNGFFTHTEKRTVIYNACGTPTSCRTTTPNTTDSPLRVGFLGRLAPHKGIELILQAATLHSQLFELYIGGKGDKKYEEHLRTTYNSPNIHFMGFVTPDDILRCVDVTVVPSLWNEPFGRVVIESYARGIPVIVSNRGGLPEIVQPGKTGFIFDPENHNSLSAILTQISSNRGLLQQMSYHTITTSTSFGSARHCSLYLQHYTSLLNPIYHNAMS